MDYKDTTPGAAVGDFVQRLLNQVDAFCDEWPSVPLDAVLTAFDTCKNRILIARMASLVSEGAAGLPLADDDSPDDEDEDDDFPPGNDHSRG